MKIASWSNVLPTRTRLVEADEAVLARIGSNGTRFIGRGAGRSYGDASYLSEGVTLSSRGLTTIHALDLENGRVTCDPGVELAELYARLEPTDWILPVGGGTRWVTVGGAIGSDIHGKNDPANGSFGNTVESLEVVLADGSRVTCSASERPDVFHATIGGMGLTGFIRRATLKLQRVPSRTCRLRTAPFSDFSDMVRRFESSDHFQVSWLDMTPPRWRGIHFQAEYVGRDAGRGAAAVKPLEIPLPEVKLFSGAAVRLLNAVRYRKDVHVDHLTHVMNVLYPVDALKHWNRFYGPRGFQEYQFVVPPAHGAAAMDEFVEGCRRFRLAPFFAVIKRFGTHERQGTLSFPMPGWTLTSDFETRAENAAFFEWHTNRVREMGGRLYLAKDSAMTRAQFEGMYPRLGEWRDVVRRLDPGHRFASDLSLRLGLKPW